MLQVIDNIVCEMTTNGGTLTSNGGYVPTNTAGIYNCNQPYYYYTSYPVYVTTDKTKKAIEVLKILQAEKLLECKSVNKFIELVEKISNIL